jgi:hypothetical protein
MTRQIATQHDNILVLPISDSEWRISDPRRRADDALCLIGFVQRVGAAYETTLIGRPLERRYFQSFEAAVDYLASYRG